MSFYTTVRLTLVVLLVSVLFNTQIIFIKYFLSITSLLIVRGISLHSTSRIFVEVILKAPLIRPKHHELPEKRMMFLKKNFRYIKNHWMEIVNVNWITLSWPLISDLYSIACYPWSNFALTFFLLLVCCQKSRYILQYLTIQPTV